MSSKKVVQLRKPEPNTFFLEDYLALSRTFILKAGSVFHSAIQDAASINHDWLGERIGNHCTFINPDPSDHASEQAWESEFEGFQQTILLEEYQRVLTGIQEMLGRSVVEGEDLSVPIQEFGKKISRDNPENVGKEGWFNKLSETLEEREPWRMAHGPCGKCPTCLMAKRAELVALDAELVSLEKQIKDDKRANKKIQRELKNIQKLEKELESLEAAHLAARSALN